MGENQGMIWIILGVLVVAAAVIFLGSSMGDTMNKSAADTAAASALTQPACVALGTDENGYTFSWDEDVDKCVAAAPAAPVGS